MSENEITMNVQAEQWMEEQFEKFLNAMQSGPIYRKDEMRSNFINTMRSAVYEQFEECDRKHSLICSQGSKLRKVVALVRGEPPDDTLWSTHDAAYLVEDLVEAHKIARQALSTIDKFVENITLKALISEALVQTVPRVCPNCSSVKTTTTMETDTFLYGLGPDKVELQAEVRVFTCYDCEQRWTGEQGEQARTAAVEAHLESKT